MHGKLDEHTCMHGKLDEQTCMHGKLDEHKLGTLCTFCTITDIRVPRTGQLGRDVGGPHKQMNVFICENVRYFANTKREYSSITASKPHTNVYILIHIHNDHI